MIKTDFTQKEIEQSGCLEIIFQKHDKPLLFLPNYGEFGPTVHKLMKVVNFCKCSKKVVCCKKGEESYFPTANEFYYDWSDFVEDKHKWGFFTKKRITGLGINEKYRYYQKMLQEDYDKIYSKFGDDFNYIHLWKLNKDPIFDKYNHLFKFNLSPKTIYNIKADIIISPRKKESRKENNFKKWDKLIKIFNKKGYSVGCVGTKDQSFHLKNSSVNSWDYPDFSSSIIELLSNCKLYLGLDTGVSHIAALMSIPMIVFSHSNQRYYFTHVLKQNTNNYFLDLGKNIQSKNTIIDSCLNYLEKK
jgi:ADP-heptose:LPS heptosyltransferase